MVFVDRRGIVSYVKNVPPLVMSHTKFYGAKRHCLEIAPGTDFLGGIISEEGFESKDECYASVMQPWLASVTSLDVNSSASYASSSRPGKSEKR